MDEITSNKSELIAVHPRLKDVLASIQNEIQVKVKELFGIDELKVYGTIASQALAARYFGDKKIKFKVKKTKLNEGILQFI